MADKPKPKPQRPAPKKPASVPNRRASNTMMGKMARNTKGGKKR